ncbi:zinc ribbon domain-containing protein [Parabacteroides goldsteinii]|uniref:zinc ribbon domain-containing protein n=1 Tax=Parabacteroides goldsteinii TaxID=328812 RepID=UPI0034E5FB31
MHDIIRIVNYGVGNRIEILPKLRNPLDINQEELLGTNGDQTKCDEYRVYCYQNGRFK